MRTRAPARHAPPPAPPSIFECDGCHITRHSPDTEIPAGWARSRGQITCPDCTYARRKGGRL